MKQRAKLDHDGIYWGPEDVEELGPGDVAAPDEAIQPGRYRWIAGGDGAQGHFLPLPKSQRRSAPGAPSLEQAFRDFMDNGRAGAQAQAWAAAFDKSIDRG